MVHFLIRSADTILQLFHGFWLLLHWFYQIGSIQIQNQVSFTEISWCFHKFLWFLWLDELDGIPGLSNFVPEVAHPRKCPRKSLKYNFRNRISKNSLRIRYHFEWFRKSYAVSNLDLCFADIDRNPKIPGNKLTLILLGLQWRLFIVFHGFYH